MAKSLVTISPKMNSNIYNGAADNDVVFQLYDVECPRLDSANSLCNVAQANNCTNRPPATHTFFVWCSF